MADQIYKTFLEEQERQRSIFIEKNKHYGNSFFQGDASGAYFNLRRKWDRIRILMQDGKKREFTKEELNGPSGLFEQLRDIANYATMTATLLSLDEPPTEEFMAVEP